MSAPEARRARPTLRLSVIGLIVVVLFAVIVLKLWSLQVLDARSYGAAVNSNILRIATVPAPRGDIVDRNGAVLVGNATQEDVVLSRAEAAQYPAVVGKVAALVGETPRQVEQEINNPQLSPYEPAPVLTNAPPATIQYLETHQAEYPGVSVRPVTVRTYPQGGTTATHVLGYVGRITAAELKANPRAGYTQSSQVGQAGLEAQYDRYLRGKDGKRYLEVNPMGTVVGTLRTKPPRQGDTLVTNLDLGLEHAVEQALASTIHADRASLDTTTGLHPAAPNGAAIVLDVRTGAVLAMASYPSYNLNEWVGGISQANYQALQASCNAGTGAGCPMDNNAISGLYTPGSTFKLNTATAALQSGLITPSYVYNDTGSFTIPNCTGQCTFHDAPGDAFGPINIVPAISGSSDVFFYNLGYMFWQQRATYGNTPIQNTAAQYSFGEKTGIDLPGEVAGQVDSQSLDNMLHRDFPSAYPNKVVWSAGYNMEMAFGQGATVITPIEQAVAYATFANGGTRYQPRLAAALLSPGGKVIKRFAPKVTGHVAISPANYQAMLQGFQGAISNPIGTAYGTFQADASPAVKALNLAGKTGTGSVQHGVEPTAWFASFGPNPNPRYAVVAVVAQAGYGAQGAAPAVAQIWNYLATHPIGPVNLPGSGPQPPRKG